MGRKKAQLQMPLKLDELLKTVPDQQSRGH